MKNNLLLIIFASVFFLSACGTDDPAKEIVDQSPYNPAIHTLEAIILNGAQNLVLKEVSVGEDGKILTAGVQSRCDELGKLEGVTYSKIEIRGQGSATPCFRNVGKWKDGIIFGQYRFEDSTSDVWFITDSNGKVHHLPKAPIKDRGFKNDKIIREYNGKPAYLNQDHFLTAFDMESDEEETVIETHVGRFLVIHKLNGDHIVYNDLAGGKRRKPDGSIDEINEINTYKTFYTNQSNDLQYIASMRFKNFILDETGDIIERAATAVPVAFQKWMGTIGVAYPNGPIFSSGIENCEKTDDLMLCGDKGFLIPDSSQDVVAINWIQFQVAGASPISCLTDDFIYMAAGEKLTKINRDLSAYEHILTGFAIYTLQCPADDNLIIHGLNTATFQYETFQLSGNIRTMITENITSWIN